MEPMLFITVNCWTSILHASLMRFVWRAELLDSVMAFAIMRHIHSSHLIGFILATLFLDPHDYGLAVRSPAELEKVLVSFSTYVGTLTSLRVLGFIIPHVLSILWRYSALECTLLVSRAVFGETTDLIICLVGSLIGNFARALWAILTSGWIQFVLRRVIYHAWNSLLLLEQETIRIVREAVKAIQKGHSNRARRLNNLANQLGDRYSCTGAMKDIEGAIYLTREAVKATPKYHTDRAAWLNNLGVRLGERYSRTRAMADLEEAIRVTREAIEATSKDHPDRAGRLNNLSILFGDRYSRTGVMDDIEKAIHVAQEAVKATPEHHPDQAGWLNNLRNRLGDRYLPVGIVGRAAYQPRPEVGPKNPCHPH